MKKALLLIVIFVINAKVVSANIMCNDGTESPSCADCHSGCCSHHGGCASGGSYTSNSYNSNYTTSDNNEDNSELGTIAVVGGGLAAGAYALGKNSKKR